MTNYQTDYNDLLTVLHNGLLHGIITENDVQNLAQDIVKKGEDPDHIFKNLLSINKVDTLEVIGTMAGLEKNSISARALLGITYFQFFHSKITINKALRVISDINDDDLLTTIEHTYIYTIESLFDSEEIDKKPSAEMELKEHLMRFLAEYKKFELFNHKVWQTLNVQFEEFITSHNSTIEKVIKQEKRAIKIGAIRLGLKHIVIFLIILAFLVVLILYPFLDKTNHESTFSKLISPIIWVAIAGFVMVKGLLKKQPLTKEVLRTLYLDKRLKLSLKEYEMLNGQLLSQFKLLDLSGINCIHSFLPILERKEPDTYLIINWLKANYPHIKIVYPLANFRTFHMRSFIDDADLTLAVNKFGITEPVAGNEISPDQIDMVILPLLAFDKYSYRVGYGKGFYDRFMVRCKPGTQFIGLSFFEPVNGIEDIDEHDRRMSACITPTQLYKW